MTGLEFKTKRLALGHSQNSLAKHFGVHRCSIIRSEKRKEVNSVWALAIQSVPPNPPWKEVTTAIEVPGDLTHR